MHAPDVEYIGKGEARTPYEFGVKISIAITLNRSGACQFALHAKALPGNPYDGHTLAEVVPEMAKTINNGINYILADAGYRGQHTPLTRKFKA